MSVDRQSSKVQHQTKMRTKQFFSRALLCSVESILASTIKSYAVFKVNLVSIFGTIATLQQCSTYYCDRKIVYYFTVLKTPKISLTVLTT